MARAAGEPGPWRGCQVVVPYDTDERVDPVRLESAVVRLVETYDVLRSAVTQDGVVEVRAGAPRRWTVPVVAGGCPDEVRDAMAAANFPLGRYPQFEVRVVRGDGGDTVLMSMDLTLTDARGIHLTGRELMRLYADPAAESRPAEAARDSAGEAGEQARSRAHWQDRLRALPPGVPLPEPRDADAPDRRVRLAGAPLALRPLTDRCAEHGLSLDAVLLTAFTDVLARTYGTDFAVPVVRWDHGLDPQRPGEFTALSWLPCAPRELSFTARARGYQEGLERDADVSGSGLPELRRAVARSGDAGYPVVYTCALDLTDRPLPGSVRAGQWLSCTPDVFLDCITTVDAGQLQLAWDAVDGRAPQGGWSELHAEYRRAVARLADDAAAWQEPAGGDTSGADDGEVRGAELHKILHEWNDTARAFPDDRLMHQLFEEQAAEHPQAQALRWRGGTMTYQELNRRANRIAARLAAEDVGPETVVAVSVPRGPMMVAVVLGILKAGGVYLPMEPHLPAERAAVILEEAHAAVVVTTADREGWPVPDGYARVRGRRRGGPPPRRRGHLPAAHDAAAQHGLHHLHLGQHRPPQGCGGRAPARPEPHQLVPAHLRVRARGHGPVCHLARLRPVRVRRVRPARYGCRALHRGRGAAARSRPPPGRADRGTGHLLELGAHHARPGGSAARHSGHGGYR